MKKYFVLLLSVMVIFALPARVQAQEQISFQTAEVHTSLIRMRPAPWSWHFPARMAKYMNVRPLPMWSLFWLLFGKTHCLLVGDPEKPRICTIHGGNGITTLNLKLFLPLLEEYCIIAPDVIGMPGKSDPYRNISSKNDEYGLWIKEVLDVCLLFRQNHLAHRGDRLL